MRFANLATLSVALLLTITGCAAAQTGGGYTPGAPKVIIEQPIQGTVFTHNTPVLIKAWAAPETDDVITHMKLYVDGRLKFAQLDQQSLVTFLKLLPGEHRLAVVAWDNEGQVGKSAVYIRVY